MTEGERIAATLKRLLKKRGFTYRRVGEELALSEATVKRMFSREAFTLERLLQLAALLELSLAELAGQAEQSTASVTTLTLSQEKELVSEPTMLLVAACVMNGWTPAEITTIYRLTKAECLKWLLGLDRLGLLTLLPGDRVRLNVARDFDWIHDGPIQRFFQRQQTSDFLASDFAGEGETLFFVYGMLSAGAKARLQAQLKRLREEFSELHRESFAARPDRQVACLLVAQREWEPKAFAAMRRPQAPSAVAGKPATGPAPAAPARRR